MSQSEEDRNAYHLQNLLSEAQGLLPAGSTQSGFEPTFEGGRNLQDATVGYQRGHQGHFGGQNIPEADQSSEDHFPVDDAENPLQLLARASDLSVPSGSAIFAQNVCIPAPTSLDTVNV